MTNTALAEYQRLEATGLWRDRAEAQRREVLVQLGEATLVISTLSDTALSHWSLPAIHRVNPGRRPAVYKPAAEAEESLEISEPDMIAAIEKLRGAIEQARPHPGRLRFGLLAVIVLAIAVLAIIWLPGALTRQTASMLPEAKRAELGSQILGEMAGLAGRPCVTEEGSAALTRLSRRVLGPDAPRVVILPTAVSGSAALPGDILVFDRGLVEDFETPEVLAGHMLAAAFRAERSDPALALLTDAGLPATLRMMTTGRMDAGHLHDHAVQMLARPPAPVSDADMLALFETAEISTQAYAYALDISGETTIGLIEADPMRGQLRSPLLSDQSWIALQEICGG